MIIPARPHDPAPTRDCPICAATMVRSTQFRRCTRIDHFECPLCRAEISFLPSEVFTMRSNAGSRTPMHSCMRRRLAAHGARAASG